MSNALAIASVTRLLRDLLNDAIVNGDVAADLASDVLVTSQPPDRILEEAADTQPTQLNLYLHRVTPNPALANSDLPTRDPAGRVVNKPRLALDLHYLLTAYSGQELHPEIVLGYAMEVLHENPILARGLIRQFLTSGVNGSILPQAFQSAEASQLADQIELIKITLQTLSVDDMSKLWTAFQSHYRTTLSYLVSVVLIERDQPRRSPLPVLSRGPVDPLTRRDAGVVSQPSLLPTIPTLTAIRLAGDQPAARLGETLTFEGFALDSGEARARFTDPETAEEFDLGPSAPATPERLTVLLPSGPPLPAGHALVGTGADPAAWRVGPYAARLVFSGEGGGVRETNSLTFTLAPRATPSAGLVAGGVEVEVQCQPVIRAHQPVAIVLGQSEHNLPPLNADTTTVSIVSDELSSGQEVAVRLRVAGVDSLIIDRSDQPPSFDPTQVVQVP